MKDELKITSSKETQEEVKPQEEVKSTISEKVEISKNELKEKTEDSVKELKETGEQLLESFKNFITGDELDKKCKEQAEKHNLDEKEIKDNFIMNALKSIAKVLHLTVSIVGDCLVTAVKFLNSCIDGIVNFSASILHKLINLVTLNAAVK